MIKNILTLQDVNANLFGDENQILADLCAKFAPSQPTRNAISRLATEIIENIRRDGKFGLMENFLAEYGLSSQEGIALMCLAEAYLRVPDRATLRALIEDKVTPSDWAAHLGQADAPIVNASSLSLMLTGKILDSTPQKNQLISLLNGAIKRLGEPVILMAMGLAMKELGRQFVLGEDIATATQRAAKMEKAGFTFSYDMLGEAALCARDAKIFMRKYRQAIAHLSPLCTSENSRHNPSISIKLSALHPRYEVRQQTRVIAELLPRVKELCHLAKQANMGLTIDAEESERLILSLTLIEQLLAAPDLAEWDGLGIVVQAYGKRASPTIAWLYQTAHRYDRRLMVRLVKGAYWDREIKYAQSEGHTDFPVFTQKWASDISYICCAQQLLPMTDHIYPQFATHNAHSIATILTLGEGKSDCFEFQRLHGMGDTLHRSIIDQYGTGCRIYAPVGAHEDLLAYLVRRLLENGANSSFVHQILDGNLPPSQLAKDPFLHWEENGTVPTKIPPAPALFGPTRANSRGFALQDADCLRQIIAERDIFHDQCRHSRPILATKQAGEKLENADQAIPITNPAIPNAIVGFSQHATPTDIENAISAAKIWTAPLATRQAILLQAADLYETTTPAFVDLLAREAGKTLSDAIAEIREAVDFLRYYARDAEKHATHAPLGIISCIAPWNFPLAIFTGQIAAALATGNGVLAKPAEQTPLIADLAISLLHRAGVPRHALQCLPGHGETVGRALTTDQRLAGVCFTGSTETAQTIHRAMATHLPADALLVAETGGINAMIVDSSALPEQAVADIMISAFQSAGQRCSALRMLYLQDDIADSFIDLLQESLKEWVVGNPIDPACDCGPVIDKNAYDSLTDYLNTMRKQGRILYQGTKPEQGYFIPPTLVKVDSFADLEREVFGPILHIARFEAHALNRLINDINAKGYGLTFGIHSRLDRRIDQVTSRLNIGNIYVNRNQIGAVVGVQPFGGEGLSGTGPKAGGPHYLASFVAPTPSLPHLWQAETESEAPEKHITIPPISTPVINQAIAALKWDGNTAITSWDLPGPTGEHNRLAIYPKAPFLCLGPTWEAAMAQYNFCRQHQAPALIVHPDYTRMRSPDLAGIDGCLAPEQLGDIEGFSGVLLFGNDASLRRYRQALAQRQGPILSLLSHLETAHRLTVERHICRDTTAAGGNATLLAMS